MTEVGNDIKLDRECSKCHYERLDCIDMDCIDVIVTCEYGELHIYKCTKCEEIDIWICDQGIWIRDYEYRCAEFEEIIREYE